MNGEGKTTQIYKYWVPRPLWTFEQQDTIWWTSFTHWILSTYWIDLQHMHYEWLSSSKTWFAWKYGKYNMKCGYRETDWYTKLITKTWNLITSALIDIQIEFKLECRPLPRRMKHVFQGKVKILIDKILHNKIKWLMSVYSVKDPVNQIHFHRERDPRMVLHHTKYATRIGDDKKTGGDNWTGL